MNGGRPLLAVESVTCGYDPGIDIIQDVSIAVPPGSVVGLIGLNGAGKSTLMRTICGFVRCRSGRVLLDGEDATGLPPHTLIDRGVWYIPQESSLFPYLSVRTRRCWPSSRCCKGASARRRAISPAASRRCWSSPRR